MVGETGVGKISFLSLFGNIVKGRRPDPFVQPVGLRSFGNCAEEPECLLVYERSNLPF
ncbi:hypothetical protein CPB85DRAFT_1333714 [Mucidula mucida]|nr:hypothetical protein CPB85DRAFT_1334820 [Mucidula mucida]KAF8889494.1 hypothetical protein CPB85DRAFT_1333714 [Mucidula mucida]